MSSAYTQEVDMKKGDTVKFVESVVRRTEGQVAHLRGTLIKFVSHGKVAVVDFHGTWDNEEGKSVRYVPANNLTAVKS